MKASPSAFCLALALRSLCVVRAQDAECGADTVACAAPEELSEADMDVTLLQRGLQLQAQALAAQSSRRQACPTGYVEKAGNIRGGDQFGRVFGNPKDTVEDCADDCNSRDGECLSFEWSPTEKSCYLNKVRDPTEAAHLDFVFCQTQEECTSGSCAVYSDPHVAGFDSFRHHEIPSHLNLAELDNCMDRPIDVNSYGTGDFWLARSDLLQLQGRFVLSKAFVPDHAAVGAVAVGGPFLDGKKLIIGAGSAVTWDGRPFRQGETLDLNLTRGLVRISSLKGPEVDGKPSNVVRAKLPLQVELYFVQFPMYLDTRITLPRHLKVDGECGNFNGVTEDDTEEAVRRRMDGGLQVAAKDVLF